MRAFLSLSMLFLVLELYVFFKVSTAIGFFLALLLIIAGSMLGIIVVRAVGSATALRARKSLSCSELPAQQMIDGLMLVLGGGLIAFPGFISDIAGLLLLFPPVRRLLVNRLRKWVEEQAIRQRVFADSFVTASRSGTHQPVGGEPSVIEGEFEHCDK